MARQVFQNTAYSKSDGEKRPVGPTTFSSEMLILGIAYESEIAVHAPHWVVNASSYPQAFSRAGISEE
jgi:hypothetical protein